MSMMQTLANSLRIPELRNKILFTAAMLALYRLGAYIPSPGVDLNTVKDIESNFAGHNILGFLSGGQLDLGLLGSLVEALQRVLVGRQVDALVALELRDQPLDD